MLTTGFEPVNVYRVYYHYTMSDIDVFTGIIDFIQLDNYKNFK